MVDEIEAISDLCDTTVASVSGVPEDECSEPVSFYGLKGFGERRDKQDACGLATLVGDDFFQKPNEYTLGISFELYGVPVLSKLTDCPRELGSG